MGASRQIVGPKFVVVRNRDERFGDKFKHIPVHDVPLESRAGSLEIILSLEGLTIRSSSAGNQPVPRSEKELIQLS